MNREDLKLNKEKQSKDTNTVMTQMLELSDKWFKADSINTLRQPSAQLKFTAKGHQIPFLFAG